MQVSPLPSSLPLSYLEPTTNIQQIVEPYSIQQVVESYSIQQVVETYSTEPVVEILRVFLLV